MNIIDLWYSLFPKRLPEVNLQRIVDAAGAKDWKTSAAVIAKCGYLVCTYNNVSRHNAAIDLVQPDGRSRNLIRTDYETFGRPILVDGWWYFPCEGHAPRIVRVRDASGVVEITNMVQPDDYSACGVGHWFAVCKRGGGKPYLWSPVTGRRGYQYQHVNGIVSGIVDDSGAIAVSVSDGAVPGVESEEGWKVTGVNIPTIAACGMDLLVFRKDGAICTIGRGLRVIGNTGMKPCRSVTAGGIVYWATSKPDVLCATNGRKTALLFPLPGPDGNDGVNRGELFDSDVAVKGDEIVVVRSQDRGGFEVWKGKIK